MVIWLYVNWLNVGHRSPSSDYHRILFVTFISMKFWKKYKMRLAQAKNKNTGVYSCKTSGVISARPFVCFCVGFSSPCSVIRKSAKQLQ